MSDRCRNALVLLVTLLSTPSTSLPGAHGLAGLDTLGVGGDLIVQLSDTDRAVHGYPAPLGTQLSEDAEDRLRLAGIVIGSSFSALQYRVTVFYDEDISKYVYDVHVSLRQTVTTDRDERVNAATWDAGVAGITGADKMPEAVRGRVSHLVDLFVTPYMAENLKPRGEDE